MFIERQDSYSLCDQHIFSSKWSEQLVVAILGHWICKEL